MGAVTGSSRLKARGAVGVMFAGTLIVIMAVFGMALDLSRLYNRKAELQNIANAAAMAAARELNGTVAGLTTAAARAKSSAELLRVEYDNTSVVWSDAALRFGESPTTGNWVELGEAKAAPARWRYAKVDTRELDTRYALMEMTFIQVAAPALRQVTMGTRAIAGRAATNVAPLAICAMSTTAAESRAWVGPPAVNELVEYGFRRGVSYDLMQLNPGGTAAESFVVDPFAIPQGAAVTRMTPDAMIGPYVCTGSMVLSHVVNANLVVRRPFPLGTFYKQLNSRFDKFETKASGNYCSPDIAPPDLNIKQYTFNAIPWMTTVPEGQTARSTTDGGKLATIADLVPPQSAANTAPMYGPLWSYARAVPFSSYQAGIPEPATGYTSFGAANWTSLYKPGQPAANSYPTTGTPYAVAGGNTFLAPLLPHKGVRNRRVLHVPLLACPVPAATPAVANVLAIGRFFMTVPATATQLSAEFGGIASDQAIGGNVELYQ